MLKKFKDFDVEQYRIQHILEKLDMDTPETISEDALRIELISDDRYLSKMSKIIMKALIKNGLDNYAPYGNVVYVNGVPGVWFSDVVDNSKSIVACRNSYTKMIAVFSQFNIDGDNTADVVYTSEKVGLVDMIKQAIDDLKGENVVEEGILNEAGKYKAGYGDSHVKKVAAWSESMKKFCVDALAGGMSPGALADEILMNVSSNPVCKDIYDSFEGKKSTLKYATNVIWDAMNHTYPELEGLLEGKLASVKPALRKSISEDFDVEAYDAEREELRKKELEAAQKDFEENTQMIKDIVDTFCHYVKQNGQLDEDDLSVFTTKGLYITGRAGSGKSYALEQTLKKNGMVNKKDYVEVGNSATDAEALYRLCYRYNGKLIILDDAANVVGGSNRIAFWKAILQTSPKPVRFPRETRESSSQMYEVGKKNRQERYFAEIGQKTNDEKAEFFKKKRREYSLKEISAKDRDNEIAAQWDEISKNTKPLIPDEFLFTGCIVVIGNMTHEELKRVVVKDGGERDWDAIRQRFQPIEIDPPYEVLWNVIQKTIREQQSMSEEELPSYNCIVPRDFVDEFIDEVNTLLNEPGEEYTGISWRMATQIGQALKGEKGRRLWKRRLKETMRITK